MIFSYHAVPTEEEMFFIGRPLSACLLPFSFLQLPQALEKHRQLLAA